jgi:hypothetical protein
LRMDATAQAAVGARQCRCLAKRQINLLTFDSWRSHRMILPPEVRLQGTSGCREARSQLLV